MLQSTIHKKDTIDLSSAPWTMHEFFAGSGLVAYGLKGMFAKYFFLMETFLNPIL